MFRRGWGIHWGFAFRTVQGVMALDLRYTRRMGPVHHAVGHCWCWKSHGIDMKFDYVKAGSVVMEVALFGKAMARSWTVSRAMQVCRLGKHKIAHLSLR